MARRPIRISVSRKDRQTLDDLLSAGVQPVRVVLRALALLHLSDGSTAPEAARSLKKLTPKAVRSVAHRYQEGGLDRALYEKSRPGAASLLSSSEKQRIVAMVCSDPQGRDERERAVVQFWRRGHLSWNTIQVYISWVRRFRAYCLRRELIEADELSLVGVCRFTSSYAGPRLKGKALKRSACDSARNAIHAWACALRAFGEKLPAWESAPANQALAPLLDEYREYRRAHNGVAEGTLPRDLDVARRFHQHLRDRRRTARTARPVDLDTFGQLNAQSHRPTGNRRAGFRF